MMLRLQGRKSSRGIVLIETLIYGTVMLIILTVGLGAFWKFQMQSAALQRNTHDIARAVKAGEQWRADLRGADEVELTANELQLTRPDGELIAYRFDQNTIWRKAGEREWSRFLINVAHSAVSEETRAYTTVWKWELELSTKQKSVRLRPLFTFLATQREARKSSHEN